MERLASLARLFFLIILAMNTNPLIGGLQCPGSSASMASFLYPLCALLTFLCPFPHCLGLAVVGTLALGLLPLLHILTGQQ